MSTTTAQPPLKLQVTRLIKAPRERVFAAWTTPADIVKWFGCDDSIAKSAKIDLRVGGEYNIHIKKGGDRELDLHGVYREIKSPSRLVFTWNWKGSEGMDGEETVVTIDLVDRNGSTEVQLSHDLFTSVESRDGHSYGWNGCFDKMEKLVA